MPAETAIVDRAEDLADVARHVLDLLAARHYQRGPGERQDLRKAGTILLDRRGQSAMSAKHAAVDHHQYARRQSTSGRDGVAQQEIGELENASREMYRKAERDVDFLVYRIHGQVRSRQTTWTGRLPG